MNNYYAISDVNELTTLMHHEIKGQKWGERNYQYEDGTLTPEGKERYRELKKKYQSSSAARYVKKQSRKGESIDVEKLKGYKRHDMGMGIFGTATDSLMTASGVGSLITSAATGDPVTRTLGIIDVTSGITGLALDKGMRDRAEKILNESADTTISEVNEYLALREAKKNK